MNEPQSALTRRVATVRRALIGRGATACAARLAGLAALAWFLIRVIPKPTRATYPCQRAAFPMAAAFVIWLLSSIGSLTALRGARRRLGRSRWQAAGLLVCALGAGMVSFAFLPMRWTPAQFEPPEPANSPIGEARGIFPGRVVWAWEPEATSWDGTGYWWEDRFTDQDTVERMLSTGLRTLTGATSDVDAWQALFEHFNERHERAGAGYQTGDGIAIKLNLNQCHSHDSVTSESYVAPQVVLALLRQLVHRARVPQGDIACYDAIRHIPPTIYDRCHAEFPDVRFIDRLGGAGRLPAQIDHGVTVEWSEPLTLEIGGGHTTHLPWCVTHSRYLINVGGLKGHQLAGITASAKNHMGTIVCDDGGVPALQSPKWAGVHPYIAAHYYNPGHPAWEFFPREDGTYNALVDMMGHPHLGGKTLLYLLDGLYAAPHQEARLHAGTRWEMAPFNGDWTSSLFLSQDGVAIDSVALDFLRTEPTLEEVNGTVDNYLHEAALAGNPPSGMFYDPDGDGFALTSLGVHEHWNNSADKQYSRNLGTGEGIELIQVDGREELGADPVWLDAYR